MAKQKLANNKQITTASTNYYLKHTTNELNLISHFFLNTLRRLFVGYFLSKITVLLFQPNGINIYMHIIPIYHYIPA